MDGFDDFLFAQRLRIRRHLRRLRVRLYVSKAELMATGHLERRTGLGTVTRRTWTPMTSLPTSAYYWEDPSWWLHVRYA